MKTLLSCAYNMDTACVEMKYADRTMIAIDAIAVENGFCDNMYHRSELDWLICNKLLKYVQLVLSGDSEGYLRGTTEHWLMDERNIVTVQWSFTKAYNQIIQGHIENSV